MTTKAFTNNEYRRRMKAQPKEPLYKTVLKKNHENCLLDASAKRQLQVLQTRLQAQLGQT